MSPYSIAFCNSSPSNILSKTIMQEVFQPHMVPLKLHILPLFLHLQKKIGCAKHIIILFAANMLLTSYCHLYILIGIIKGQEHKMRKTDPASDIYKYTEKIHLWFIDIQLTRACSHVLINGQCIRKIIFS